MTHLKRLFMAHLMCFNHQGVLDGELRQTCTACATTLLLEFGLLSHQSGNASYGRAAAGAAKAVFAMRSRPLGLPGNTLDCDQRAWVRSDSGVGAGADSYYEYLLKVMFQRSKY